MIEKIIDYITTKYNVEPNHPWKKYPEYTTFKDVESSKWFVLLMNLSRETLGLREPGDVWVMNVKADPEFIMFSSNMVGYMPGYHMNKQHWLTVLLDGSVPMEQIFDCIDRSYTLVTDTPTKRIYEAVKQIPKGKVATYGKVAEMAGNPKMSRAVGNALHKNPDPEHICCHRVVNAKGELAKAFVFGGEGVQAERLRAEGVEVVGGKVDLKKYGL